MRVLLDTCAFLWLDANSPRIPHQVRRLITHPETKLLLSLCSVWEIAIKTAIGKLNLPNPIDASIDQYLKAGKLTLLPIGLDHVLATRNLPLHHRDPFDRLIAAQALAEGIPLITADSVFERYGVRRVWE